MERKLILERIDLHIRGFGEKLNYFLGFWEQRQTTLRELRNFLSGIRGDQYIISREQGSTSPCGLGCGGWEALFLQS